MKVEIQVSEIELKQAGKNQAFRGQEQHNNQGLGTDLFVRKNQPGSVVGKGYTIDIFENGVKVDTVIEHNKDRVLELVKKYKDFYHTNRAFQNEIQLHVTYKRRKDEGKQSMDIAQELYKRANRIQELSYLLINPDENIKKFADDLGVTGLGEPPIHQMTPSESFKAEENPESIPTETVDSIVEKTLKKLVEYFENSQDKLATNNLIKKAEDDGTVYNELKKWFTQLGDILKENNAANPNNEISPAEVSQKVKSVVLSGDPTKYQEYNITVSPEIAMQIKDQNSKAVTSDGGTLKEDAAEGGDTTAENMDIAAKDNSANIKQAFGELPPVTQPGQTTQMQNLTQEDLDLIKQNPNVQTAIEQAISTGNNSVLKQQVDAIKKNQQTNSLQPVGQVQAAEFWKYVKTASIVGDLDKVFLAWASGKFASLEEISAVWENVHKEATSLLDKKATPVFFYKKASSIFYENQLNSLASFIREGSQPAPSTQTSTEKVEETSTKTTANKAILEEVSSLEEILTKLYIEGPRNLTEDSLANPAAAASTIINEQSDKYQQCVIDIIKQFVGISAEESMDNLWKKIPIPNRSSEAFKGTFKAAWKTLNYTQIAQDISTVMLQILKEWEIVSAYKFPNFTEVIKSITTQFSTYWKGLIEANISPNSSTLQSILNELITQANTQWYFKYFGRELSKNASAYAFIVQLVENDGQLYSDIID